MEMHEAHIMRITSESVNLSTEVKYSEKIFSFSLCS